MAPNTAASAEFEPPEPQVLDLLFPEYEVVEMIGRGGMGAVYKARQPALDRVVAIKILPPGAASDAEFAERFRREAAAMAALDHPNIVTLHDFGEREGCFFFIMEYVEGVDLAQRLASGSLTTDEALLLVPQICDALQYSHDRGIVHRDIKPGNILIGRSGKVKIADFGLAKLVGTGVDEFALTRTSASLGTPRYMAPEQIETAPSADHRADVYALGVVLYEMLTGEVPAGRFEPPSQRVAGLADYFDPIILRAMDADPEKRFNQISELKSGLIEAGEMGRRLPGGTRQVARRFWWSRVFPVALVSALLTVAAIWWFTGGDKTKKVEAPLVEPSSPLASWHAARRTGLPPAELEGIECAEVATGGNGEFFVGLLPDGSVIVRGDSTYGQTSIPDLGEIVAVAAGEGRRGAHALALGADGRVVAWGDNTYRQCEVPEAARSGVVEIAAGEFHSLALRGDGTTVVWGHSRDGATDVPPEARAGVRMIAAGAHFNLALTEVGDVIAWGANNAGQCEVPDDLGEVTAVYAAGDSASADLRGGGRRSWGRR
ncbi:MAG: protein kinase domain-containing protein [Verrucomicrobiales bacterium]